MILFIFIAFIIGFFMGVVVGDVLDTRINPFKHLTIFGPEENEEDGWLN